MASRKIEDLHPKLQGIARKFLELCAKEGIDVLIYCTYRSFEEQAELYAQGRTKPGKIVTYAKPGYSYHNYGLAFDCVPLVGGKPVWDKNSPLWQKIGEIGKSLGLKWGGDFTRFKEYPHFQLELYPIEELVKGVYDDFKSTLKVGLEICILSMKSPLTSLANIFKELWVQADNC